MSYYGNCTERLKTMIQKKLPVLHETGQNEIKLESLECGIEDIDFAYELLDIELKDRHGDEKKQYLEFMMKKISNMLSFFVKENISLRFCENTRKLSLFLKIDDNEKYRRNEHYNNILKGNNRLNQIKLAKKKQLNLYEKIL